MKNFLTWAFLTILIVFLIFTLSPSARKWWCGFMNKNFKDVGDQCSNCDTGIKGIITESGDCIPQEVISYEMCVSQNSELKDGQECSGCGADPKIKTAQGFSGKGVIVDGKCVAIPDAFAGKICVPASAPVNPAALSYKRILSGENTYRYFKNNGSVVSQREGTLDEEITRDEYIQAYVQTIKTCPQGQVKV